MIVAGVVESRSHGRARDARGKADHVDEGGPHAEGEDRAVDAAVDEPDDALCFAEILGLALHCYCLALHLYHNLPIRVKCVLSEQFQHRTPHPGLLP